MGDLNTDIEGLLMDTIEHYRVARAALQVCELNLMHATTILLGRQVDQIQPAKPPQPVAQAPEVYHAPLDPPPRGSSGPRIKGERRSQILQRMTAEPDRVFAVHDLMDSPGTYVAVQQQVSKLYRTGVIERVDVGRYRIKRSSDGQANQSYSQPLSEGEPLRDPMPERGSC